MHRFIQWLWHPKNRVPFFLFRKMLFPFFYIASWGYRLGFALHRLSHTIFGTRRIFPARIISVGNLSVGGTGKSVFVRYLLSFLDQQKCGVVMRGYARKNKQKKNLFLLIIKAMF